MPQPPPPKKPLKEYERQGGVIKMAELAAKYGQENKEPIAQDRYMHIPIYREKLIGAHGRHRRYNLNDPAAKKRMQNDRGVDEYISIDEDIPQHQDPGEVLDKQDMFGAVRRHEIAHGLQHRTIDWGKEDNMDTQPKDYGAGTLDWGPGAWKRKMDNMIGPVESNAYALSGTTKYNRALPQDDDYEKIVQDTTIDKMEKAGMGRAASIFKRKK